ncbi:MAG: T9SS type A sorting domain-containing protein, partial [Candidatus Eisenbacteria bacterium]|nr:T9SS type A sorting domain-containing protein [Candidatus Eisenbacteria bacterium]
FINATTIAYSIPQDGLTDLSIYSVTGRKIKTLVHGQEPAGVHQTQWDGCDQSGERVSSGVYFYRLETSTNTESRRLVLISQ